MYAIEFDTTSKDGVIYIPKEYKDELGNRENIRLIVMYDMIPINNINKHNDELNYLEKLFSNSNNELSVTRELAINTEEMVDDIS
jgi:bifunctional DNA-binding transcriptional regulator/antitoxin component of YhaV-PrlF toxin-antitoxin module